MKKVLLLFIALITAFIAYPQRTVGISDYTESEVKTENNQKIETVMGSFQLKRISGFGGPTMTFTTINDEFATMMGGGGGVLINNVFIGGYGEGTTHLVNTAQHHQVRNIDFGHGGFWLGYEIAPHKVIHPVISTRIGWGNVSGRMNETDGRIRYVYDNVFVLVPTVSAEINFTRFFKVNVGAEYRRTFGVNNLEGLKNENFSSAGIYMNFIFGWF